MIELFLKVSHWSDAEFQLLYYVILVIGFLMSKVLLPACRPIGRIAFLLGLGLSSLLFAVLDGAWLFLTVGHRHGLLDAMILALALIPLFHGVALQQLSSARANDMWHSPKKDWLAIVPFGVFWFIFVDGQKAAAAQNAPYSAGRATLRVLRDCILIMVGLSAYASAYVVAARIKDSPRGYSAEVEKMWLDITATLPAEDQFRLEVQGTRPVLPFELDEQTTMIAIRAAGDHLYLTYKYAGDAEDLSDIHGWFLIRDACGPDLFQSALLLGGTIHYEYTGSANRPSRTYTITAKDCPYGKES